MAIRLQINKETIEKIIELMPEKWEEEAKETKALTRSRKIKNAKDLLILNLLYQTSGETFGKTSAMLKLMEEMSLNKNAVYERILKSAEWLRWLSENICRKAGQLANRPTWLEDKQVCLIDATDESRRGSNKADYRLHYCVELFSLKMIEMHLSEAKLGEKLTNFKELSKNSVVLADRAYATLTGIEYLKQCSSEFVLRLRANAFNLYNEKQEQVELTDYFQHLKPQENASVELFYKSGNKYEPIRICAMKKTKEDEEKGLERIKKSNSKKMRGKVSEKQSIYNKYVILVTNMIDVQSAKILELYRTRWQIELVFKRLKSIFSYDEMPSKVKNSVEAWFYGKLLLAAICETLVNKGRFSPGQKYTNI